MEFVVVGPLTILGFFVAPTTLPSSMRFWNIQYTMAMMTEETFVKVNYFMMIAKEMFFVEIYYLMAHFKFEHGDFGIGPLERNWSMSGPERVMLEVLWTSSISLRLSVKFGLMGQKIGSECTSSPVPSLEKVKVLPMKSD